MVRHPELVSGSPKEIPHQARQDNHSNHKNHTKITVQTILFSGLPRLRSQRHKINKHFQVELVYLPTLLNFYKKNTDNHMYHLIFIVKWCNSFCHFFLEMAFLLFFSYISVFSIYFNLQISKLWNKLSKH